MNEDSQKSITSALISRRAEQFSFLGKLFGISSESTASDYRNILKFLTYGISALGFDVETDVLEVSEEPHKGTTINANLIIRHEFGPGPTIALSANGDTAPVGGDWKHDPFGASIVSGRMYGRGCASAKGDIAAYLYALKCLHDTGKDLFGTVEIHIYFDGEKDGAQGPQRLLEQELSKPDIVISNGSAHSITSSVRGRLSLLIEVQGHHVPQSMPEQGGDALASATAILSALNDIRKSCTEITSETVGIGTAALSIVRIEGMHGISSQPGKVRIEVDRYLIPEEDPAVVEMELTNQIGLASIGQGGTVCRVRKLRLQETMKPAQGSTQLIELLQKHSLAAGDVQLPVIGTARASAGRHYAAQGIPTVFYGDKAGINGPDEFLELDDLRQATATIAMTIASLLSSEDTGAN